MRRILALLFSVLALIACSGAGSRWASIYNDTLQFHVVRLYFADAQTGCTGVVINTMAILTADHCTGFGAAEFGTYTTRLGEEASVKVVSEDKDMDMALVVALPMLSKSGIPFASANPKPGDELMAVGFMTERMLPFSIISRYMGYDGDFEVLDKQLQHGFSGGPLVNEKGQLVGINLETNPLAGLGYSRPLSDIQTFLEESGHGRR